MIRLGVDTLCWHLRLERGAVTVEDVLEQAGELGAECVQVNLHHLRARRLEANCRPSRACAGARAAAARLGRLPRPGARRGRTGGGRRPRRRLARARDGAREPVLRVVSGFYRAELWAGPTSSRRSGATSSRCCAGAPAAEAAGVTLLLENHSDFTAGEYARSSTSAAAPRGLPRPDQPDRRARRPAARRRGLAPLARAGHVKDYVFGSIQTDDAYHRRGFEVLYRYPGEGVADLQHSPRAADGLGDRDFYLTVEGLDNRAGVDDQRRRLGASLDLLRSRTR